jgi:hypothetical protein
VRIKIFADTEPFVREDGGQPDAALGVARQHPLNKSWQPCETSFGIVKSARVIAAWLLAGQENQW